MPAWPTINELLEVSVRRYPERPALGMAFAPALSYQALSQAVHSLSAALLARGLRAGDRVAIVAENSPQWGMAYLAITGAGGVAVPLLPDFPAADIAHVLRETEAKFVFTSARLWHKAVTADSPPPGVFTLDDSAPAPGAMPLSDLLQLGAALPQEEAILAARPEAIAAIIYTSGTSGHAKAVMLSHANLSANVRSAQTLIAIPPQATFLSILPLSHTYEFTAGFLLPLSCGARVVFVDQTPTPSVLATICRHEQPDVICAVPLIIDKIYKKKVLPALRERPWLRQAIKVSWLRRWLRRRAGAALLDFFGGQLKVMAIGGAALSGETETFLREARFPYLTGYGLTEASPLLAAGGLGDPSVAVGSVGPPVPGVELRIGDPAPQTGIGRVLARGANIMLGYYGNPTLTAETIDRQGWLDTGDLGLIDERGNLHLKGRTKSVIVLANGENVTPEILEERINCFAEVLESLVVADDERLTALIHLDQEQVDRKAKTPAARQLYVQELLRHIKQAVNREMPPYAKLQAVIERREPFIKTATHKIKRYLY